MDTILLHLREGTAKEFALAGNFLPDVVSLGSERDEGTLVIVTFDESEGTTRTIVSIPYSSEIWLRTNDRQEYNHYSVLRMIEDNFSLPQLNSGDANAAPITEAEII